MKRTFLPPAASYNRTAMSGLSDSREETLLVLRAQTGDREALDRLFQRVEVPLLRHLTLITRNPDDAQDVAQQVFLLVYRKLAWLRDPALFRAWLYRIAARQAIAYLSRRRARGEDPLFEMAQAAIPMEQSMTFDEVRRKIDGLPPAARAVVALHYIDGYTLEESSAILGIPLGTAKSRLWSGVTRLRKLFQTGGE
jgi:RNA polymerase sigma-70 factor (ECF subfamily)